MSIRCGKCLNVMPMSCFADHKKRKHQTESHVPYEKLPEQKIKPKEKVELVKCRFCTNRIPEESMKKHVERYHIFCWICLKTLIRSKFKAHMEKHVMKDKQMSTSSQIKPSKQLDYLTSDLDALNIHETSPILNIWSIGSSTSSSSSESSYPSPNKILPKPLPSNSGYPPSPNKISSFNTSPIATESIIRCTDWQLHDYIRQGRVYTKDGCLYLRHE